MNLQEVIDFLSDFDNVVIRDYHLSISQSIGATKSYCLSVIFEE